MYTVRRAAKFYTCLLFQELYQHGRSFGVSCVDPDVQLLRILGGREFIREPAPFKGLQVRIHSVHPHRCEVDRFPRSVLLR